MWPHSRSGSPERVRARCPTRWRPVVAGTGAAAWLHAAVWWKALLALVVAVALIIGVNYANDYSDGIRGTDDDRAGPVRLVGSRLATPRAVLTRRDREPGRRRGGRAGSGGAHRAVADRGRRGLHRRGVAVHRRVSAIRYAGFGEVAVFVFFGLVAVLGHAVHAGVAGGLGGLVLAVAIGGLSSSVLVANNLRDIPTDAQSGKLTLAVRLGDARTRVLYQALLAIAGVLTLVLMAATPWCAVGIGGHAAGRARRRAGAVGPGRARVDPGIARHRADDGGVGRCGGNGAGC